MAPQETEVFIVKVVVPWANHVRISPYFINKTLGWTTSLPCYQKRNKSFPDHQNLSAKVYSHWQKFLPMAVKLSASHRRNLSR